MWGKHGKGLPLIGLLSSAILIAFAVTKMNKKTNDELNLADHPFKRLSETAHALFFMIAFYSYFVALAFSIVAVSIVQIISPNLVFVIIGFSLPIPAAILFNISYLLIKYHLYSDYFRIEQLMVIKNIEKENRK